MSKIGNAVLVFIPAFVATRCEANHSPPNAEIKNQWSYTSALSYLFTACTGTNFILFIRNSVS